MHRTRADFTMLLVRVKYGSVWILLENHHHMALNYNTPVLRYYASQEENSELVFLFCQIDADAGGSSKLEELIRRFDRSREVRIYKSCLAQL